MRTRTDIHVMLLGDPGLGKSQLLRAAAAAAPRGLYLCSSTASAAGLTVACVRDAGTGEMAFEAGALVTADRGICCLDEFDKMASEHKALLEAMEQQEVRAVFLRCSVCDCALSAHLPQILVARAGSCWTQSAQPVCAPQCSVYFTGLNCWVYGRYDRMDLDSVAV